jgi:membrane associated rhomboid family serine protease
MARKIFIAYLIYTVIIFLVNSYILKENYVDAIVKAVLSGVVFAALYAIVLSRAAKRQDENKG